MDKKINFGQKPGWASQLTAATPIFWKFDYKLKSECASSNFF